MDLPHHIAHKVVSAEKAVAAINRGSRVFIGTGCGEPQHLIHAMVQDQRLQDILIYQMLSHSLSAYVDDPGFLSRFSLKLFFISQAMRKAAFDGKIDYVPVYLSQIEHLFASRRIGLDVALVQVSPPDQYGYCSLGVSVDITRSGMTHARMVIAQINPRMPRTWGDSFVHIDEIDYLVWHEEPLVESIPLQKDDEVVQRIGYYLNQVVDDGATLQVGFGHLPYAIIQQLRGKKDIGIHTQLITDAIMPLVESGMVTNREKNLLPGRIVASLCMGSEALYRFVDDHPMFYFRSSAFVNDPTVIARNDNLVSISSALEVDLTGQVCSDSVGYLFYSGIGDQVDFIRGSAMSRGGFSIIALPSTAQNGTVSRIVSHLSSGAGVATTRGDANFIITEYGIAELGGKSIYQRVMELAQIAHPKFRDDLIAVARKRHLIFADQQPPSNEDLLFIEAYKCTRPLPNGRTIEFRPLLPSDEFSYRNFFYSLKEETIYSRFFYRVKVFPHQMIQKQWASVDYRKNMSVIGQVLKGGSKEIVGIGSYAQAQNDRAEVAFVVREDYHGMRIASELLGILEAIAIENDYIGFTATILRENGAMLRVFQKRYPNLKTDVGGNEMVIHMDFKADPSNPTASSQENP